MQAILKVITACALFLAIGTSALKIVPYNSRVASSPVAPSVPLLTPMLIVDSVLYPNAAKIQIYVALAGTYTPQQETCVDSYSNQVISRLADGGNQIASCIHTTGGAIKKYFLGHGAANISIEMAKCVNGPELTIDCYVRTLCVFTTPKGGSVDSCVQAEPCVSDEVQSMQDYMDSAANELAQCYANN